jgi:hypothetical protein
MLLERDSTKRLARSDAFALSCPLQQRGAGLAPARWPDQKPVRPCGRDPSQSCRRGFAAPDRHRSAPNRWRYLGCWQSRRTMSSASTRTAIGTARRSLLGRARSSPKRARAPIAAATRRCSPGHSVSRTGGVCGRSRARDPTELASRASSASTASRSLRSVDASAATLASAPRAIRSMQLKRHARRSRGRGRQPRARRVSEKRCACSSALAKALSSAHCRDQPAARAHRRRTRAAADKPARARFRRARQALHAAPAGRSRRGNAPQRAGTPLHR